MTTGTEPVAEARCNSFKWGEFNPLRCCREKGHAGEHNYVVSRENTPQTRAFYGAKG